MADRWRSSDRHSRRKRVPEGHTIHRYARLHREAFAGQQVTAASPQGRFSEGAHRLHGSTLDDVEAYGKHLFYRFTPAGTLHVHLGLFGRFRTFAQAPPPPTPGTRLTLTAADGTTLYLAGAITVELIGEDEAQQIVERLGPDPLRPDADPAAFCAALARRSIGIGHALLDQRVIAGVGNAYRSEVLFLAGIHPDTPAKSLSAAQVRTMWTLLASLLASGEQSGRIMTVHAEDRTKPVSELTRAEGVYVYKRAGQPCWRCGTEIVSWKLGGRLIYACPRHQPR